ncbi:uncharacterized protein [Battus philenor]|uniref:uncharacterized protein n=1 Tax=Battus philenor TaxID=42288 RepID=UPI0035CFB7B5
MMKYLICVLLTIAITRAQPKKNNVPMNMITVPPNCPEGQQLVNGVCRDIWRQESYPEEVAKFEDRNAPLNMITVPANCPPGQQLINGVCRDVWRFKPTSPLPPMVEETEKIFLEQIVENIESALSYDREKRQVDFDIEEILQSLDDIQTNRNIISVPNQCPAGYKPDILGICRPIFD